MLFYLHKKQKNLGGAVLRFVFNKTNNKIIPVKYEKTFKNKFREYKRQPTRNIHSTHRKSKWIIINNDIEINHQF